MNSKVVEPWWTKVDRKTIRGKNEELFFQSGIPNFGASEKKVVQPFWTRTIQNLPSFDHIELVDTFNKVTIGTRKPGDVVTTQT